MKTEARSRLVPFLVACGEGNVSWLYLDRKGIPTIGVGNALFGLDEALALSWVHRQDGSPAQGAHVRAAWDTVLSYKNYAGHGAGAFQSLTTIRATSASLAELVDDDVMRFEVTLRKTFPDYDAVPAPVQLGLMRLAWALGPHFAEGGRWPNFRRAWVAKDWRMCAVESRIPELDLDEPKANGLLSAVFNEAASEAA